MGKLKKYRVEYEDEYNQYGDTIVYAENSRQAIAVAESDIVCEEITKVVLLED